MKTFLRLPLLATAALSLGGAVLRAQPAAYLETASVSILWNFSITGVSGTTIGLVPIVPGTPGAIDPDALRPLDRITTDIGSIITYSVDNGNQAFFTKQLIRVVTERYATRSKSLLEQLASDSAPVLASIAEKTSAINAINTQLATVTDPVARAALIAERATLQTSLDGLKSDLDDIDDLYRPELDDLEGRINYLRREADGRWELTAVREPQTSVQGVATTPYALFLTRIERVRGRVSPTYDTGLRLVPIASTGSSTETYSAGNLTRATGNYTTHFRLEFESLFATDPLSALKPDARAEAIPGEDYNTAGDFWFAFGTGYMTYTIRSTPPPLVAVLPSRFRVTGHGTWGNIVISATNPASFGGIAPLSIKMGEVIFQNRGVFPEFDTD